MRNPNNLQGMFHRYSKYKVQPIANSLLTIVFVILVLEISSKFLMYFFLQGLSSTASLQSARESIVSSFEVTSITDERTEPADEERNIPHPYLGYIKNPASVGQVYEFWYKNGLSPIQKRSNDRFLIGIVGGSVAQNIYNESEAALIPELKKIKSLENKEILLISLARGGYKQPQQLMTLAYLYALGAEFDLIINIDGFNESALPFSDNRRRGVYPFYPREWLPSLEDFSGPRAKQMLGEVYFASNIRHQLAKTFSTNFVSESTTANLFWKLIDFQLQHFIQGRTVELMSTVPRRNQFALSGPQEDFSDDMKLATKIGEVWLQSSRLLSALCASNNTQYFHFLQANQYDQNSKVLSSQELKVAFREDHPYRQGVVATYPILKKLGHALSRQGIHFYDQSNIFSAVTKTIYSDDCCHYNSEGNLLFARTIGAVIRDSLRPQVSAQ